MPVTLNSAGIQFSDSTTQNSAATGGASIAATQVSGYSNFYQHASGQNTSRNTVTSGVLTVGTNNTAIPFQHNYTNQLFVGFQYYYQATQQDVRYYSRTHYRTVS